MKPIDDHLKKDLKVIFIGFNPSVKSAETGYHYQWGDHSEYATGNHQLLQLGYGLTNIVSRPTKAASDITKEEYQAGRLELLEKLEKYQPEVACYVGKGVYQEFSKKKKVSWGFQSESVVPGVIDFVAPSSSGLVRMKIDEIVDIYKQLREMLRK